MYDYPKTPTNSDEAVKTLIDFVRTAPGRLPERVEVAIKILEKLHKNASI